MHRTGVRIALFVLLATIVAPPPILGQSGLRSPRKGSITVVAAEPGAGHSAAPVPPPGQDIELLIGELSCRTDPFGPDVRAALFARGTMEYQTSGMGEVAGRIIVATENPCPGLNEAVADLVQSRGCVTGAVVYESMTFVCHDRRERVLETVAAVSRLLITGTF